jgi:proline-specific peptidase
VLLLHGGPGFSHEYLEAFESFLPQAGIEMYYYDQLGCNNSDQPDDPSLWTLARYTEEVEVRRALGLEHFVLFGHSWGGMLMPDARYAFCPNGSHLCMWDDQAAYFKHLLDFLRAV